MASPRIEVVELLDKALPDTIDVIAYSHNIEAPGASTVMVRIDRVIPSTAGQGLRTYEFALVLIAAKTTSGPADDELDALLEDVLFALASNDTPAGIVWIEARRAAYGEPDRTNPAYEIRIQATTAIEQE